MHVLHDLPDSGRLMISKNHEAHGTCRGDSGLRFSAKDVSKLHSTPSRSEVEAHAAITFTRHAARRHEHTASKVAAASTSPNSLPHERLRGVVGRPLVPQRVQYEPRAVQRLCRARQEHSNATIQAQETFEREREAG